jgi:hypothetical protein
MRHIFESANKSAKHRNSTAFDPPFADSVSEPNQTASGESKTKSSFELGSRTAESYICDNLKHKYTLYD